MNHELHGKSRGAKFFKTLARKGAVFILILLLGFVTVFYVIPTVPIWLGWCNISRAFSNARSVTIVEFVRGFDSSKPDLLLHSQHVSAGDLKRLRSAFAPFPRVQQLFFTSKKWIPHHRIDIVRSDGSLFSVEVCFTSNEIKLVPGNILIIPSEWEKALHEFFVSAGMPLRQTEEYQRIIQLRDNSSL